MCKIIFVDRPMSRNMDRQDYIQLRVNGAGGMDDRSAEENKMEGWKDGEIASKADRSVEGYRQNIKHSIERQRESSATKNLRSTHAQ